MYESKGETKPTHGFMQNWETVEFNECIAIDHAGPLPATADKEYQYITNIIDRYSGYVVSLPTKTPDALSTAQAISEWIHRFRFTQFL